MTTFKILRKLLIVVGAIFSVALGGASLAFADGTGGGIGGGGGNTGNNNQRWVSIAYNDPGLAWAEFTKPSVSGYQMNTINREVGNRVVGGIEVCKASQVIWFLESSSGWSYNYTGYTHGSRWGSGKGTIETPLKSYGARLPSAPEVNAFKVWDAGKNGYRIDKTPGYTIICSGAFNSVDLVWSTSSQSSQSADSTITYRYPYHWLTDVQRQISVNGKDPIGVDNLHNQSKYVKTNFGLLYDQLSLTAGAGITPEQLQQRVQAALDKDKALAHSTLNLSANNLAGMAEGGVLNFFERTQYAEVTATVTTNTIRTQHCTYRQTWNSATGAYNAPVLDSPCTSTVTPGTTSATNSKRLSMIQNTGFYQMLSVHCNPAGVAALRAADSALNVVSTGDTTQGISAVLYTKKYNEMPTRLDFGDLNNPNAAKRATASVGFYDKECGFECTPSSSSSHGASTNNGAVTNLGSTSGTMVIGGKYGAQTIDGTNNNSFDFFRDNEPKHIKMDVWYPRSSGVVAYNGHAPISTTVVRDKNGTPSITGNTGGKFTMKTGSDGKGKTLFTGDKQAVEQKNWNKGEFSNSTGTLLDGFYRDFTVQASWASDKDKPQILNVKWEYRPTVSTRFYGTNVGFSVGGKQNLGTLVTASTTIEGKCYSNFGTNTSIPTVQTFNTNTGTGTTNNLDRAIFETSNGSNASSFQTNLVVNFVRSTTE